jgi:hypothetical protein
LFDAGAASVQTATGAQNNPYLAKGFAEEWQEAQERSGLVDRVRSAMDDKRWRFRTADGIGAELGIDAGSVGAILERPDVARRSPLRDAAGRAVYASTSRREDWREHLARIRTVLG